MTETFVVIDDHESVLEGTCSVLQSRYPEAEIKTASTAIAAQTLIKASVPELILVVMDLSMPKNLGESSQTEVGLDLLRSLLKSYPKLNFVVQSAHVRSLVRLKPNINAHRAGFTIADKSLPSAEMLVKVDWSLNGLLYTPPEMRTGIEVKPEWLEMLQFAFVDGITDKAIAQRMNVSERTVRHYWTRVQDALEVYPNQGINIRIQTYNQARKVGLLD